MPDLSDSGKASALNQLSGKSDGVIEVPAGASLKSGQQLTPDVVIGSLLGSGLQGDVYRLDFVDQTATGWVLKAVRGGLLASTMPSMACEWAVGRQLVLALGTSSQREDESAAREPLRGFMRTGAAVVSADRAAYFRGQVLEFLSGCGVSEVLRRMEQPLRIQYVREMLSEVFHALAAAQKAVGFRHWDLRLANVMEHEALPSSKEAPGGGSTGAGRERAAGGQVAHASGRKCFKIIDFGHAEVKLENLSGPKGSKLPGVPATEKAYRLFWYHRHDVFRILMSLQNVIDGRTWRSEDCAAVEHLQELIRHVTGVRLRARFEGGLAPQLSRSSSLRLGFIRTISFWHFLHGRLSAREALQMPFFVDSATPSTENDVAKSLKLQEF